MVSFSEKRGMFSQIRRTGAYYDGKMVVYRKIHRVGVFFLTKVTNKLAIILV